MGGLSIGSSPLKSHSEEYAVQREPLATRRDSPGALTPQPKGQQAVEEATPRPVQGAPQTTPTASPQLKGLSPTATAVPQTHVEDEWLIVVSLSKQELYLYRGSNLLHTYNVATGKEITPTPLGRWRIVQKEVLALGTEFGSRWMRIERFDPATQRYQWTDYGIHGTDEENKIGTPVSAGCIRMRNQDVEELYALVPMETMVITEQ